MPDLPEAILDQIEARVGRRVAAHRGVIKAVNTTAGIATVTIAAGDVTSMRWLAPYVPAVNDPVLMLRVAEEWIVLGKISQATTPTPGATRTIMVTASAAYRGFAPGAFPNLVTWSDASTTYIKQGQDFDTIQQFIWAGVALYNPPLTSLIPSGASVVAARVAMHRVSIAGSGSSGVGLVSPVIFPHAYTSQPPDGYPPAIASGFSAWRPGALAIGERASWALPSAWVTGMLAGTIKGLGIYSTAAADMSAWASLASLALEITYTYTP